MGRDEFNNLITFLNDRIIFFLSLLQVPYVDCPILMASQNIFFYLFIILPEMFEVSIYHEEATGCYFGFFEGII